MSVLWQDIRYALRVFRTNPAFTGAVVLIIGIAIGANTALFNALDQLAMRPLPIKRPHDLVSVQFLHRMPDGSLEEIVEEWNYHNYEAHRDRSGVFADLAAFTHVDPANLRLNDVTKTVHSMGASVNYFSMLGIRPALGRLFVPTEEQVDTADYPVAVIGHGLWHRQFGGSPDVIGKQIILDNRAVTIIGVTPATFTGTIVGDTVDVYLPLGTCAWQTGVYGQEGNHWLLLLGRLKPGVSREQAQAALRVTAAQMDQLRPGSMRREVLVFDGSRGYVPMNAQRASSPLALFMGSAVLILVIACANVSHLQLARGLTRYKEIAIRQALGARRWHVVRQLLTEGLLQALAAGLFAVVLATGLNRAMCVLMSRISSVTMIPGFDWRVYLFALIVSVLVGLIFGLTPACQMLRRNVVPALKDGSAEMPRHRWNLHHLLVIFQVAVAVAILICTAFFVRSGIVLNSINPGYDTTKLIGVSVQHSWILGDRPDLRQSFQDLRQQMENWPGIEGMCFANLVPLGEAGAMRGVTHIDGMEVPKQEQSSWWYASVGPEYFKILNMPLFAGRTFTDQDNPTRPKVMVINDVMARKYWPNQDPLGKHVTFRGDLDVQVIGVVGASKMRSIIEGERPIAYWPLTQDDKTTPALLIRTTGDPKHFIPRIQKEVASWKIDEVCSVSTISDRVADLLFPQRAVGAILKAFASVALLLCITGLYSVVAFAVRQRTREIGIRIALGAETRHVVLSALGKSACLAVVGLGLGLAMSFIAVRLLECQLGSLRGWNQFLLYGADLWDPLIFLIVSFLALTIALLASYLPARRAARVDPLVALRCE